MKRSRSQDGSDTRRVRRKIDELPSVKSSTVVLKVGSAETAKTFIFEKDQLMRHSDLFKLGLATTTTAHGAHKSDLPELDSTLFQMFHRFVLHRQIYSGQDDDYQPSQLDEPFQFVDEEWLRLANAWIMGDFLMSCSFKDAIVDAFIAKMSDEDRYPVNLHEVIYPASKPTSAVRKLLVDIAVWRFQDGDLARQGHKATMSEFYYDVVLALNAVKSQDRSRNVALEEGDLCRYHEHGDAGKVCYRMME